MSLTYINETGRESTRLVQGEEDEVEEMEFRS